MDKFTISQYEYDRLCNFEVDRSTAQYIKDAFEGCDYGWEDWDTVIDLGEDWENNRAIWFTGFRGELTLARRKELVDLVYEVGE